MVHSYHGKLTMVIFFFYWGLLVPTKANTTKKVKDYLNDQNFIIMDHPPYSPDLATYDFWLFDLVKQRLDDHTSAQSLVKQIINIVNEIPKEECQKTFDKWIERMELCIKNKGDYF